MSSRDILNQYPEFDTLFTFLTCRFGDYWDGKTEAGFITELVQEDYPDYVKKVYHQLTQFLAAPILIETKREIVRANNIYHKTPEETVAWLNKIKDLLEPHVTP